MKLYKSSILICVFVFCGAHALVNETFAANDVNETSWNVTEVEATESFIGCPDGWYQYADSGHVLCIFLSEAEAHFADAYSACQSLDASLATGLEGVDNMAFIQKLVVNNGGEFWTSLLKAKGYSSKYRWQFSGKDTRLSEVPHELSDFPSYKEQCVYMSSYSEAMETDDCFTEYKYVCQKPIECPPGRFGTGCERQCHCVGAPCGVSQGKIKCPNGCQRGWVGDACDIARRPVDVKYYCARSEKKSAVYIRVFTNGVENITVYHTTERRGRGYQTYRAPWRKCIPRSVYWKLSGQPGVSTIRILAENRGNIYYYSSAEDRWTHESCSSYQQPHQLWRVHVFEKQGVQLEHDVMVEVKCNFTQAPELSMEDKYHVHMPELPKPESLTPESISDDVALTLVDLSTDKPATSADLGTPVKLRIKYGLKPDSELASVIPKSCKAKAVNSSSNNDVLLIDAKGCVTATSPVSAFTHKLEHGLETRWFPLFRLPNATDIYITCGYSLCFKNEKCAEPHCTTRRFRRSTDRAEDRSSNHLKSQTVRVVQHEKPVPSA